MVIHKSDETLFVSRGEAISKIEPGLYSIEDNGNAALLSPLPVAASETVVFRDRQNEVLNRFGKWKTGAEKFRRLGLPHKYSILIAGAPGTGKTVIVREFVRSAIADGYIVISLTGSHAFRAVKNFIFPAIEQTGDELKILFIWDDLDLSEYSHQNEELKVILDGIVSRDGTFFLFSSNTKIEEIDEALTRSGRFDKIYDFTENTDDEKQAVLDVLDLGIDIDISECKTIADVRGKLVSTYVFEE